MSANAKDLPDQKNITKWWKYRHPQRILSCRLDFHGKIRPLSSHDIRGSQGDDVVWAHRTLHPQIRDSPSWGYMYPSTYPNNGNRALIDSWAGNQKKKTRFAGLFSYRPSAGTAPSAQHAVGALRLRRPPLPTGSPLRPARRPTHDWIDVAPIHV